LGFIRGSLAGQHITVHGGDGDDTIVGSFGHDEIYGDAGADSLNAGVDEDTLFADTQDVSLVGGGGIDSLVMSGLGGVVVVTDTSFQAGSQNLSTADGTFVGIGSLFLFGSNGPDTFDTSGFHGVVTELYGFGGNDVLRMASSRGVL